MSVEDKPVAFLFSADIVDIIKFRSNTLRSQDLHYQAPSTVRPTKGACHYGHEAVPKEIPYVYN